MAAVEVPASRILRETWLVPAPDEVRQAVASKSSARRRGSEARQAPPDWLLDAGLHRDSPPVHIHVGGCWNAEKLGFLDG